MTSRGSECRSRQLSKAEHQILLLEPSTGWALRTFRDHPKNPEPRCHNVLRPSVSPLAACGEPLIIDASLWSTNLLPAFHEKGPDFSLHDFGRGSPSDWK